MNHSIKASLTSPRAIRVFRHQTAIAHHDASALVQELANDNDRAAEALGIFQLQEPE